MRLLILAVGQGRSTPEGALVEDYLARARAGGKRLGFTAVALEEVAVSKLREARARILEEGERLAARIPPGAHVIVLDARGKGMTSESFAEMLASLRDAGVQAPVLEQTPANLFGVERDFLQNHTLIPLLFLPRAYAIGGRVRDLQLRSDGTPLLANASLQDAP